MEEIKTAAEHEAEGKRVIIKNEPVPIGAFTHGPRIRIGAEDRVLKPYPLERVVILGMGLSLWDYLHMSYGNPSHLGQKGTEVWTLNYAGLLFRCDLCFNIHEFGDNGEEHGGNFKPYVHIPDTKVVSVRSYDWLPNSYEFPICEFLEDGFCSVPYLKNTTSYAIAFAMLCRVKQIDLFGTDFDYDPRLVDAGEKYERGRANVEFWLGRATAFGIDVNVAPSGTLLGASDITHTKNISFYGYDRYKPNFVAREGSTDALFTGFHREPTMAELQAEIAKVENGDKPS